MCHDSNLQTNCSKTQVCFQHTIDAQCAPGTPTWVSATDTGMDSNIFEHWLAAYLTGELGVYVVCIQLPSPTYVFVLSSQAPLLQQEYRARGLKRTRSLLTIHNIAFQGWMSPDMLEKVGLDPDIMAKPHLMLDDSRPGFRGHDVSLLRGGVVFADKVTTVSPTYATEVYTPEFGFGMQVSLFTEYRLMVLTCWHSHECRFRCLARRNSRCYPAQICRGYVISSSSSSSCCNCTAVTI